LARHEDRGGGSIAYLSEQEVAAYLDKTFGKGKWRLTSGYRSRAEEDALRRRGAGTVPAGETSAHSRGTPEAPGAEDIEVPGMPASEVARKLQGGPFTKAFAEGRHGPEGAHVHAEPMPEPPKGFALDAASDEAPAPPKGFTLDAAPTSPPALPTAPPTPLQQAKARGPLDQFGHIPMEAWRYQQAAGRQLGGDLDRALQGPNQDELVGLIAAYRANPRDPKVRAALADRLHRWAGSFEAQSRIPSDFLNAAGGALARGGLKALVGEPVSGLASAATGGKVQLDPDQVGGIAGLALAIADPALARSSLTSRASSLGTSPAALEAAEARGVQFVPKRPQAAPTAPATARPTYYRGMPVDSFNRNAYNQALGEIGQSYPRNGPVGVDGITAITQRFSDAYSAALKGVRLPGSDRLVSDLASFRDRATAIGKPQDAKFEATLNNDVLSKFGPKGMDGETFKGVYSDLRRQSRSFKRSADPNDWKLGSLLDDVATRLRSELPKKTQDALSPIDRGYRKLLSIQGAGARRAVSGGLFTPQDMLAESKSEAGDQAFSQGRGLYQREALAAHRPKPSLGARVVGGAAGAAAGSLIGHAVPGVGLIAPEIGAAVGANFDSALALTRNHLAASTARRAARIRGPNYLSRVDRRVLGPTTATGALLPPPQQ
jgi:hypothetical protein